MSVELDRSIYGRAADVIRERGWWQGRSVGDNGEVCLNRSLRVSAGLLVLGAEEGPGQSDRRVDEAYKTAQRRLRGAIGVTHWWNDEPGRTVDDVYTLLKFAEADELETWRALYGPEAGE